MSEGEKGENKTGAKFSLYTVFNSTHGKLDLTLEQNTDDGTSSQMVWVIVNCKYKPRQHA